MTITFLLNDENDTLLFQFFDIATNPFKIGDIIDLTVDDVYPAEYLEMPTADWKDIIGENNKLQSLFNNKKVKIISEHKNVTFKTTIKPSLSIEYICEIL